MSEPLKAALRPPLEPFVLSNVSFIFAQYPSLEKELFTEACRQQNSYSSLVPYYYPQETYWANHDGSASLASQKLPNLYIAMVKVF